MASQIIFLTITQRLTLSNVIIHIKSVLNKDKNHYYCNTFLEKFSYHLDKKLLQEYCW